MDYKMEDQKILDMFKELDTKYQNAPLGLRYDLDQLRWKVEQHFIFYRTMLRCQERKDEVRAGE